MLLTLSILNRGKSTYSFTIDQITLVPPVSYDILLCTEGNYDEYAPALLTKINAYKEQISLCPLTPIKQRTFYARIVYDKISLEELKEMAGKMFDDLVKAVVDVEKGSMVVDATLHSDEEAFLLEHGSLRKIFGV